MTHRYYFSNNSNHIRTRWATLRRILFISEDVNPYMDVDVHGLGRRIYRVNDSELAKYAMDMLATGDTVLLYIHNREASADVIFYQLMIPNPEKSEVDRQLKIAYSKARSGKLAGLMEISTVDEWISSGDVVH